MEIGKLPILDEKLEMACDRGHIYLCQYFESNQWEEELNMKCKHLKGQLWPRVNDVFVYSCPAPLPGQLWPRVNDVFAYSCPAPLPGQLWPRVGHVFVLFFKVVSWFFMVFGWFPWFFKVVSWVFMVFGCFPWFSWFQVGLSWFQVGFSWFFSGMYPPWTISWPDDPV